MPDVCILMPRRADTVQVRAGPFLGDADFLCADRRIHARSGVRHVEQPGSHQQAGRDDSLRAESSPPAQEQEHADAIAKRIVQLGGEPDFSPDTLTKRSHAEYVPGKNLVDMVKEDLIAERIAIDSYKEMIEVIGDDDTTTRRMLEWILSVEEEHADDLAGLLDAGR